MFRENHFPFKKDAIENSENLMIKTGKHPLGEKRKQGFQHDIEECLNQLQSCFTLQRDKS